MDVGFANPLGTFQMVSILSCMRSLSDVLYTEKFLNQDDQNKPIATVNALYHYLSNETDQDLNQRKLHLAEALGDRCNLNGTKDLDLKSKSQIANKMLNDVVESVVFDKYGSIDGFVAYSFLSSSDYSKPLEDQIKETLKRMTFLNENGESSSLDAFAVEQIFQDLIKPSLRQRFDVRGKIRTRRSPLTRNLMPRGKLLKEAVQTALKSKILQEAVIRNELKQYAFQPKRTEVDFIKEWQSLNFKKAPTDFNELKIKDAEVYYKLKYLDVLDKADLTIKEATQRIDTLYPIGKHAEIRKKLSVENVWKDFIKLEAYKYMRFEDYFAIRWYGDDGYKKMGSTSDEEQRMKNAIYRLAIRQFEDPEEKFAPTLYRGESRIPDHIEKELSSPIKEFQFTRFTSSSTDKNMAIEYSMNTAASQTRVLYEMTFPEAIVRARADNLLSDKDEKETILLPGTKFHIDSIEDVTNKNCPVSKSGDKPKKCIIVKLTAKDKATTVEREKNIMQEISNLEKTGTKFYDLK